MSDDTTTRPIRPLEKRQADAAVSAITKVIGSPRKMPFGPDATLVALAELTGAFQRLTLRSAEEAYPLVQAGWKQVPPDNVAWTLSIFGKPGPLDSLDPRVVRAASQAVSRALAEPGSFPLPSHIVCSALANLVGQVARMTARAPEDVFPVIARGWSSVTEAEVDAFQRAAGNVERTEGSLDE